MSTQTTPPPSTRFSADAVKAQAAKEWANNFENCNETFEDEGVYTRAMLREKQTAHEQTPVPVADLKSLADMDKVYEGEWNSNLTNCWATFTGKEYYISARRREQREDDKAKGVLRG